MKIFRIVILLGLLAVWTWVVAAAYDFGHFMSAASDGAGRRVSGGWLPFVGIWAVPIILYFAARLFWRRVKEAQVGADEKKA